jgi:predicted Zn-dependent peptidase
MAITAADVTHFQGSHYGPDQAVLVIAGDLSEVDATGATAAAFGDWRPSATLVPPDRITPGVRRRQLIHRDGAVQADVRIGWYGIDHTDPRWADLQVALAVMGGTFTSRLNTVLREERGYTYGVHMSAHPFRSGGLIDLTTSTRTATTKDLIDTALDLLTAREPFTDKEVDAAIGYLAGSAPLAFGTAEAVASQAASLVAARLDPGHVTKSLAALSQVTPQSAVAAYRDLIDPDRASIIVVADADDLPDLGHDISR